MQKLPLHELSFPSLAQGIVSDEQNGRIVSDEAVIEGGSEPQ